MLQPLEFLDPKHQTCLLGLRLGVRIVGRLAGLIYAALNSAPDHSSAFQLMGGDNRIIVTLSIPTSWTILPLNLPVTTSYSES
jgi:hypothetical protein